MNREGYFAQMVGRHLGKFPGWLGEVVSAFKAFTEGGWGKGLSGLHFKKIIDRDPSVFTTTWAELRQEYFQGILEDLVGRCKGLVVPLPTNADGCVISDREVRENIKQGWRLMYNPFTSRELFLGFCEKHFSWNYELLSSAAIPWESIVPTKPYWFWIDCSDKPKFSHGGPFERHPSTIEYVIAHFVCYEEMGDELDAGEKVWLRGNDNDSSSVVLGGGLFEEMKKDSIQPSGAYYEEKGHCRISGTLRSRRTIRLTP